MGVRSDLLRLHRLMSTKYLDTINDSYPVGHIRVSYAPLVGAWMQCGVDFVGVWIARCVDQEVGP